MTVAPLSITRGASVYVGALLGPGLLLLPGLAAAQAGPASTLAWAGLLVLSALLAVVFGRLGRTFPSAAGVVDYARAGFGPRAGAAAGWCFLAAVTTGVPLVCIIGGAYVTDLTGGGRDVRCLVAVALLLAVLALATGGLRASSGAQVGLMVLLLAVIVVGVVAAAPAARAANWSPFLPHGPLSLGRAAGTLMLSFVGWEAAAPLTTRFADPDHALPRVIAIALGVTTVLYLGLAAAIVGVLGARAGTDIPLAALLETAFGRGGSVAAAVVAVVLTMGTTNAYLSGATELARALVGGPTRALLLVIAASGVVEIGLYAGGLLPAARLITVPTALFLVIYVLCTASAARRLTGRVRTTAAVATVVVAVVLACCGWPAAVAVAVAGVAAALTPTGRGAGCPARPR